MKAILGIDWPELVEKELGVIPNQPNLHQTCPICGKKKFRFDNIGGKGTYICTCGSGNGVGLLMDAKGISLRDAMGITDGYKNEMHQDNRGSYEEQGQSIKQGARETANKKARAITALNNAIKGCKELNEDTRGPVYEYLLSRGIKLCLLPEGLRPIRTNRLYNSETKEYEECMLLTFYDRWGNGCTLHRTFIDDNGHKSGERPKRFMPGLSKLSGGVIQLFEPGASGNVGMIAEGVETALKIAQSYGHPCQAAGTAALLESYVAPSGIEHLVIFGDNDSGATGNDGSFTGQAAAYSLAKKISARNRGVKVYVMIPPKPGSDWLDRINEVQEEYDITLTGNGRYTTKDGRLIFTDSAVMNKINRGAQCSLPIWKI